MEFTHHVASPLGGITLASDGHALTGLWFDGQRHFPSALSAETTECALPVFDQADEWLGIYFSGKQPPFTPPLAFHASEFRCLVWSILRQIPYGQTITYGEIAKLVARQQRLSNMSAQAVGGAVGHNPIGIIIPCHRVVAAGGCIGGYAAGIDRKMRLLALEGAILRKP